MKRFYAVIGSPVAHSASPKLYAPMFAQFGVDADFLRIEVTKDDLCNIKNIVQKYSLSGFAVTMPHKQSVLRYLDEASADAVACGAVNIVVVDDGRLIGYNTDGEGLLAAICASGLCISGARCVIVGAGGAALAACQAIDKLGGKVYVVARDDSLAFARVSACLSKGACSRQHVLCTEGAYPDIAEKLVVLNEKHSCLANADILINATPLGMQGFNQFSSFDYLNLLPSSATVVDMVYRQNNTELLKHAASIGLATIRGEEMLFHQGRLAFKLWTGFECAEYSLHRNILLGT